MPDADPRLIGFLKKKKEEKPSGNKIPATGGSNEQKTKKKKTFLWPIGERIRGFDK